MTTHRTIRLPLLALLALIASVGCGRPSRDADLDQMARRFCGEYRAKGAGASGPRLDLSEDHTFRFVDFPADRLPMLDPAGEKVVAGEGRWRADSDDGSLVASLVVTAVNGRPASGSLIFRFGSTGLLISPPNNQIGEFVPTRDAAGIR